MDLGSIIKSLRLESGLSQIDFANKLDVHFQTVSKWERNVSSPDFSMLGFIAKGLDIKFDRLFGIESPSSVDGNFDNVKMGETLKTLRKEKSLSQSEFAVNLGVSPDTVSKWERGLICPDYVRFKSICDYFNVLPSELYFSHLNEKEKTAIKISTYKRTIVKNRYFVVFSLLLAVIVAVTGIIIAFIPKELPYNDSGGVSQNLGDKGIEDDSSITDPFEVRVNLDYVSPVDNINALIKRDNLFFCSYHQRYCSLNKGIDFSVQLGDPVYSMIDGTVTEILIANQAFSQGVETGVQITITNSGHEVSYWSIRLNGDISLGKEVKKGDKIGTVAKHHLARCQSKDKFSLHVEVKQYGESVSVKELLNY